MTFHNNKGSYTRKETGWEIDSSSTDKKKTYKPKNPDELLKINFVTIEVLKNGSFDCSLSTDGIFRANKIVEEYHRRGGSKDDIYDSLDDRKVLKNRNAEEAGLILKALDQFHSFDKTSKEALLNFIKLNDFPNQIEPSLEKSLQENCTIS